MAAHPPRAVDDVYVQLPQRLVPFLVFAEARERRGDLIGHVTRQLQCIALRAADDGAIALAEQSRDYVQNTEL